jgi:hypothetical protein
VESCTAIAEHFDGRMEIIQWTEIAARPAAGRFVPVVIDNGDVEGTAAAA